MSVAALLLASAPASAAPVATTATLGIAIPGLGATFTIAGSGTVSVTGGGNVIVPEGLVALTSTVTIPLNSTLVNAAVLAPPFQNAAGTLSIGGITNQLPGELACEPFFNGGAACNSGGGLGGSLALDASVAVEGLIGAMIPLGPDGARVGIGGTANLTLFQFDSAGWTTGVATVSTEGGPQFLTGTAGTLVSPVYVNALGNALPIFATFTIDALKSAPEPGTLLLLGAGVAGLVALGRGRK